MNQQRLLKLADLLEADASNPKGIAFDLNVWLDADGHKTPTIRCGTAACAVGLACLSPEFRSEGLGFKKGWAAGFVPAFGEHSGWSAVKTFFDLDDEAAWFLFSNSRYELTEQKAAAGELAVARRIRAFVAGEATP